jgi:hypothetical protein
MKLRHYIGIYVIASNDINIEKLSTSIEKAIKRYFINPQIILETNEPYWKEPESSCIVYSILNNQMVKLSDIITFFPISWDYKEGSAYNLSIQQEVNTEEGIWSKLCHPEEQFLMPEIDWVHIYTGEEEESPTIN